MASTSTPEHVVCTPTFVFPAIFPGTVDAMRARGTQGISIEKYGFNPHSHLTNLHPNSGSSATSPLKSQEIQKPTTSSHGSDVKTHTLFANNDCATTSRNFMVVAKSVSTSAAFPTVDPCKLVSAASIVAAVEKQEDMRDKLWPCPACQVSFKTASDLQAHLSHHTKDDRTTPCEICDKLEIHIPSSQEQKSCSCGICGSGFSYHCKLLDHMRTHTGDKPFHCDVCGKTFSQKNHLTRHSMIHTGERPYPCDFCGRGFYRKDKLSRHRRIHTGEKPYICLACGKSFYRRDKLTRHIKMHSGEKPFMCAICGKRFVEERDLKRHKCPTRHLNNITSQCQMTVPCSGIQQQLSDHPKQQSDHSQQEQPDDHTKSLDQSFETQPFHSLSNQT
ncbi:uncharacterized protein LOC143249175 isoform X3 [Tachypleus tridentatus]|uniref:uncharacterized protein LOC143249175 isoform X3 n=1 Tax=Tachypleus tridentatus TaxID=6853 RepID=UPI003FD55B56